MMNSDKKWAIACLVFILLSGILLFWSNSLSNRINTASDTIVRQNQALLAQDSIFSAQKLFYLWRIDTLNNRNHFLENLVKNFQDRLNAKDQTLNQIEIKYEKINATISNTADFNTQLEYQRQLVAESEKLGGS